MLYLSFVPNWNNRWDSALYCSIKDLSSFIFNHQSHSREISLGKGEEKSNHHIEVRFLMHFSFLFFPNRAQTHYLQMKHVGRNIAWWNLFFILLICLSMWWLIIGANEFYFDVSKSLSLHSVYRKKWNLYIYIFFSSRIFSFSLILLATFFFPFHSFIHSFIRSLDVEWGRSSDGPRSLLVLVVGTIYQNRQITRAIDNSMSQCYSWVGWRPFFSVRSVKKHGE